MSSCSLLQNNFSDLGIVVVKFDHQLGPLILFNQSSLDENSLMNLAIKGTSTLMNGLPYSLDNSRRFRGLLQISDNHFVYGFDLVLIDDQSDMGSFIPILLFIVFPTSSIPIIGSNIKSIEQMIYNSTQNFLNLSHITSDFGMNLLSSIHNKLF